MKGPEFLEVGDTGILGSITNSDAVSVSGRFVFNFRKQLSRQALWVRDWF